MKIETTLFIENNAGNEVEIGIVAEYHAESPANRDDFGRETECFTSEQIDILYINGQDPDQLFKTQFAEAYSMKRFFECLEDAVREQVNIDFEEVYF